jgi:predicted RNase H-like nuclease (RuvC/YqgF family)
VLDLHGNLVHLSSRRSIGKSEIIRVVSKFGKPLIVAVDVVPAPKNVERIASSMGSLLFVSKKSMSSKEKNDIVKRFRRKYKKANDIELKIKGKHERDALAAAVKAWKSNSFLFRKVDNALRRKGLEKIFDDVVRILINNESENITNAINEILRKKRKMKSYAKKKRKRKKKKAGAKKKRRGKD